MMLSVSNRLLGIIGILCSPMMLVIGFRSRFEMSPGDRIDAILGLLFLTGWACSIAALWRLRAAGPRKWPFAVAFTGLTLAALQQIQDYAGRQGAEDWFYRVCDLAWPASVLFLLILGWFTVQSGVLRGWRAWTPVFCGIALPVMFIAIASLGTPAALITFGVHTTIAWALLGFAVASAR